MIPQPIITAWRTHAPWAEFSKVEQDLVLTRAVIEIYSDPLLSSMFAFRGGTAMQKLFFASPTRYSEDIDLVLVKKGPIGSAIDAIRKYLDPWLGQPRRNRKKDRVTMIYRFQSEGQPTQSMRLKIEVNTSENFVVRELQKKSIRCATEWFTGESEAVTYELEELLGTKLRALYQRKKGRDLFDMAMALHHFPKLDPAKVLACFEKYMKHQGVKVSRAQYEANLAFKMKEAAFIEDILPLLAPELDKFDFDAAHKRVATTFISLLPGEPWKGEEAKKKKSSRPPK